MHRILAGAVLICLAATLLQSQERVLPSSESAGSQEPRYRLSVDVELVNVTATVIDESGKCVDGLTADDFSLLEDGEVQQISFLTHDTHLPISLGLVMDVSGSLQDKLRQAFQVVRGIAATLAPDDEMFVITFNSRIRVKQAFTSNQQEIQSSLHDVRAKGETAVYDAIAAGVREMQKAKYERRILLLVTDGFDTRSKTTPAQVEDLVKRSGALFYAIGIDDDNSDPSVRPRYRIYDYMLNKLASAGSGTFIRLYKGRDYDPALLSEQVLANSNHVYTLGYYPTAGRGHVVWRNIEVHVARPGARILNERLVLQRRDLNPGQ
jgi:Ca-activated chloride channel family protein